MNILLQKKANQFREQNGINCSEAISLKSFLLKLNILTIFRPLSEGFSGMALKIRDNEGFILVNSNHSIGRQHFTIAHELYHLFIQDKFEPHQCKTGLFDKKNKEEYNADYFASCLLMPETGITELIPDEELTGKRVSLQSVIKLEQYFSVSRSAMLIRLKIMGLCDKKKFEQFTTYKTIETAHQYGYDTSLYKKGNHNLIIGDYGEKARKLFDMKKISEGHYMELMQQIGIDITIPENDNEN